MGGRGGKNKDFDSISAREYLTYLNTMMRDPRYSQRDFRQYILLLSEKIYRELTETGTCSALDAMVFPYGNRTMVYSLHFRAVLTAMESILKNEIGHELYQRLDSASPDVSREYGG